jgi:putative DNA primase/helicase
MLVLMRNIVDAAPQAIQRTAIAADGTKIGRKTLGPSGGAAVMLDVVAGADELSVSEGFETALTAHQLGQRPVWALGSAGEIAKFPVLDQVTTLNILAENDVANERAVAACADRWMSAGREVFIIKPKSGSDLNNAFCSTRSTL